ncbi:hypothetical protein OG689_01500 [Kitasatospora sp. NBC_00240]|uniref:hypothetical protein n=1 Tax=Kitasatospora sp. NBC_00240 TaxID=2903567 RepID=UPI00224D8EA2|nr:hypothetical protein [Kitasatospora sp. NBC_00240]MCX5208001.1 hypothetical protein [Kitasatospora sp. NBC_00240]
MRRQGFAATAGVAVGTAVLLLAGCGQRSASGAGSGSSSAAGAKAPAVASTPPGVAELQAQQDALFPEVAARCAGAGTASAPSPSASAGVADGAPDDPSARKYAENHAYKQTVALTPQSRCRGDAHAARITAALKATGRPAALGEAELRAELERLGYPTRGGEVHSSGGTVGFSLWIPGSGPCLTGTLGATPRIQAHGAYLEGGCNEPQGGH